jgi:hypothetical protein
MRKNKKKIVQNYLFEILYILKKLSLSKAVTQPSVLLRDTSKHA